MNKFTNGLVVSCLLIIGLLIAGCSSGGGGSGVKHVSIAVTPANRSIAAQTTQQFTATGTFSDNTTKDLTTLVTWNSSDTSITTIDSNGKASALAAGTITITATLGTISGTSTLTVSNATLSSIAVTPTNPSIAANTTQQFTATGKFSDNTTQDLTKLATWSSSDTSKATVDSNGKVTAVAAGTPTITATLGTISGTTTLPVTNATLSSIAVTPDNPSIAAGTTQQFTATGTFSDNTTQDLTTLVTWSSSDTSKATIAANGLASAVAAGPTTITAILGTISGTTILPVTNATLSSIAVTPDNPSIAAGTTQQFTATGTYSNGTTHDLTTSVTWSSSAVNFATISNAAGTNGEVTGLAAGTTTITATSGLISGSTNLTVTAATLVSIAVTPDNPGIALRTTQQFTATGTFSDNTTQDLTTSVTWSSSAENFATISNAAGTNGKATGLAAGTTTITATSGLISGSTNLTVTATASALLVSIAVTPGNSSISANPAGTTLKFTATGTFSDNLTQDLTSLVTWSSSDNSKATIEPNGKATTVAAGTTTITATSGSIQGSTTLTVTNAALVSIAVTPANPSVDQWMTRQFTATGTYSDTTTQNLTALVSWSSSAASIATISNASTSKGLAIALAPGPTTIKATSGSISGSTILEVKAAD